MDKNRFIEFMKLMDKVQRFPNMTLTEKETELIKEIAKDNLKYSNYGPKTKKIFEQILDTEKTIKDVCLKTMTYISTNNSLE